MLRSVDAHVCCDAARLVKQDGADQFLVELVGERATAIFEQHQFADLRGRQADDPGNAIGNADDLAALFNDEADLRRRPRRDFGGSIHDAPTAPTSKALSARARLASSRWPSICTVIPAMSAASFCQRV